MKKQDKKIRYVFARRRSVFIVLKEPEQSQYGYRLLIKPLSGFFYSAKEKKKFNADELRNSIVYLNLKGNTEWAKKGMLVLWGFNEGEFVRIQEDREDIAKVQGTVKREAKEEEVKVGPVEAKEVQAAEEEGKEGGEVEVEEELDWDEGGEY